MDINECKLKLNEWSLKLEKYFECDVISYTGRIAHLDNSWLDRVGYLNYIKQLETLKKENPENKKLVIFLTTLGGSPETVEKLTEVSRYNYEEIYFVIPHLAMSAGTLWALSGNKIFMSYSASLGPLDPQIPRNNGMYPALGFLDEYNKLCNYGLYRRLTEAEILLLNKLELADIRLFEQFRDLSVNLVQKWLIKYNLSTISIEEKNEEALKIAKALSDNNIWHSHSRKINISNLKDLKIDIEDYSQNYNLKELINNYHESIMTYFQLSGLNIYENIIIHNNRIPL